MNVLLINDDNKIRDDYELNLSNAHECKFLIIDTEHYMIDKCLIEEIDRMLLDASKTLNEKFVLTNGYRSLENQKDLFELRLKEFKELGVEDPYKRTLTRVAHPGYSEHHTGLALDIVSENHHKYECFGKTENGKWLRENCYKYGFIMRYPNHKQLITKTDYEPWHIRYVGKELAYFLTKNDMVLEELYDKLYEGCVEFVFENKAFCLELVSKDKRSKHIYEGDSKNNVLIKQGVLV